MLMMIFPLSPIEVKFVGLVRWSEFKVTGGRCFLAENESGKPRSSRLRKSRPELETVNK